MLVRHSVIPDDRIKSPLYTSDNLGYVLPPPHAFCRAEYTEHIQ